MATNPKSAVLIGTLAVAIAAIASYSLYTYLKGQEERVQKAVATEKIVVAAEEIPVGSAIKPGQVKIANWPKAELPKGDTFSSPDQVAGRVGLDRFVSGEPIVGAKLVPKEGQSGILSYRIPEGHRAMTVAVDQVTGVAGFINPGNKVDVVLTVATPGSNQPVSKIVLQNIPVLAVGQIIAEQKDGKPQVVPTVTMDVTPEDAEKLAIASTQGRLQLVLRRAGDAETAKTSGETIGKVMTGVTVAAAPATSVRKAAPAKPVQVPKAAEVKTEKPADLYNVEVYRGSSRTVEGFKQ